MQFYELIIIKCVPWVLFLNQPFQVFEGVSFITVFNNLKLYVWHNFWKTKEKLKNCFLKCLLSLTLLNLPIKTNPSLASFANSAIVLLPATTIFVFNTKKNIFVFIYKWLSNIFEYHQML